MITNLAHIEMREGADDESRRYFFYHPLSFANAEFLTEGFLYDDMSISPHFHFSNSLKVATFE